MKMHATVRLTTLMLLACLSNTSAAYAAAATTTFTVTANVPTSCSALSAANLAFGDYANAQIDATSIISVTCTSGSLYTVGLSNGANYSAPNRRMTNGSAFLNYELYSDATRLSIWNDSLVVSGTGTGSSVLHTVYGRLPATQGLVAGAYTDTITVTVTF